MKMTLGGWGSREAQWRHPGCLGRRSAGVGKHPGQDGNTDQRLTRLGLASTVSLSVGLSFLNC